MQRVEQAQGVHMAIRRAIGAADDLGADIGQDRFDRLVVEHLQPHMAGHLIVQPPEVVGTLLQFILAQTQREATRTAMGDVDAGLGGEVSGEIGPEIGGLQRPACIFRHGKAFALHPDQREIAA